MGKSPRRSKVSRADRGASPVLKAPGSPSTNFVAGLCVAVALLFGVSAAVMVVGLVRMWLAGLDYNAQILTIPLALAALCLRMRGHVLNQPPAQTQLTYLLYQLYNWYQLISPITPWTGGFTFRPSHTAADSEQEVQDLIAARQEAGDAPVVQTQHSSNLPSGYAGQKILNDPVAREEVASVQLVQLVQTITYSDR